MKILPLLLVASVATPFGFSSAAMAGIITVNATDDLYNAAGGGLNGTTPIAIDVTGASSITFLASPGATVSVNGGGNVNDADGVGSAQGEVDSGTSAISGITSPTAGYVAGVFYITGAALPAALDFTGTGGTSFTSLSPLLNQAFYIGDGLTGDQSGTEQTFYIPAGATSLYLGLTDACGYNGGPSCYDDNSGSFTVNYTTTASSVVQGVPEPASMALFGAGLVGVGLLRRRQA